ncbi:hypothetical protein SH1V18_20980 [Vallitalea longa]|uniref:Uncharacterized protein n=1 Tax=Vallitalea longa TaxID=2936439 RepID=A0A9W5YC48_9FIRM|nr:hypothetical protein [Vallitalea longa]GKX29618.1 hypothetical protein SH1V18_20980 [Vallitalea longa]
MGDKKEFIDESFMEYFSAVYPSTEQGVNSSVSIWSHIKKHNQSFIFCSINKNECMYMIELLAKLDKSIYLDYDGDVLYEIEDIWFCGVMPPDKELEVKWKCKFIHAFDNFYHLDVISKYIIIEWAIMYREYDKVQKEAFEKYIEEL